MKKLSIPTILSNWILSETKSGVITHNTICRQILKIYIERFLDESITKKKSPLNLEKSHFYYYINKLIDNGVLSNTSTRHIYTLPNINQFSEIQNVYSAYKYGYISYISAMYWYGITDRIPKTLYLTVPELKQWKKMSLEDVKNEYSQEMVEYEELFNNLLDEYPKSGKFLKTDLYIRSTKNYLPSDMKGNEVKVREIGQLFIDMLNTPSLCGGVQHVMDVFLEYGMTYSRKIIISTDRYGSKIDKARIGFLLNTVMNIEDTTLNKWKKECVNERGSSRKLIASDEFCSIFSPEWNLSINYQPFQSYGITKNGEVR